MVMASTEIRKEESAVTVHPPLLSIVVPVYNGSRKIEFTLQTLKARIEKLDWVVAKLEDQRTEKEASSVYTGRKVIGNAGSAMLLDEYITYSKDVPNGLAAERVYQSDPDAIFPASPWYEVIVVNDGSKDDTRDIVDGISSTDETIRLISYSTNMGKGYAIKQGVMHSRGKYVIFVDGDGEISTEVLSKYLESLSGADIAIGSKYHPESVVTVPGSRRFFSRCFNLLVRAMLGIKVSDTQVGLKAGKGDMFRKIFRGVLVKRYAFDAEMLAVAGILGLKVAELPVKIVLDRSFKKKEIAKMALDVLGVAFRLRVIRWYQKNMEKKRPSYRAFMLA